MSRNLFTVLGLPADPGLTDDDVRIAWRRIAVATHPDRADGGDPVTFAAAAAAYSDLRTGFRRAEALADLSAQRKVAPRRSGSRGSGAVASPGAGYGSGSPAARMLSGPPGHIAVRLIVAVGGGFFIVTSSGWRPASIGLLAGLLIVTVLGVRHDLAARQPAPWN